MTARPTHWNAPTRVALLILACFLLASTGWLSWLYHLTELAEAAQVDMLSMGVGYPMQAAGIAAFCALGRTRSKAYLQITTTATVVLYVVCLAPATLAPDLAPTLAFGYLASLLCGYFQSYYLYCLASLVPEEQRGMVFGGAYAVSTGASWLLSAVGAGAATRGLWGLLTCGLLAALAVLAIRLAPSESLHADTPTGAGTAPSTQLGALACGVVLLMSATKGMGFSFPTIDLMNGVSLEFSRLLYGVGLLAAGFVSDRDRRWGALCCAGALVMPFFMLALSGAAAPATLMWALAYLLNGFFSVFRVVVLADLAAQGKRPLLAGLGLLFGRLGDALGTTIAVLLGGAPLVLVTVSAVFFACTIALFFVLYQQLYAPVLEAAPTEQQLFDRFAARHDLSSRERDVLRLLLQRRSNAEIAGELFVSEATVKFHVRNILHKTGCTNRRELADLYAVNGS